MHSTPVGSRNVPPILTLTRNTDKGLSSQRQLRYAESPSFKSPYEIAVGVAGFPNHIRGRGGCDMVSG